MRANNECKRRLSNGHRLGTEKGGKMMLMRKGDATLLLISVMPDLEPYHPKGYLQEQGVPESTNRCVQWLASFPKQKKHSNEPASRNDHVQTDHPQCLDEDESACMILLVFEATFRQDMVVEAIVQLLIPCHRHANQCMFFHSCCCAAAAALRQKYALPFRFYRGFWAPNLSGS